MTDIGPKTKTKTLRDDFSAAKQDDPRARSLAPAFEHLSKSLEVAKAFNRPRHHGIIAPISERFLAVRKGVSNHGEYARTDPSADSDPLAASNADDGRNERGQRKARALAGALAEAQVDEKAGRVSGQTYDPCGSGTGQAPLRGRPSSFGPRASRGGRRGHSRHRHRRSHHG